MSKVTCIDVSYCQTGVNYKKVKSAGIEAVIIRAGYGRETSQKDVMFEKHYENAKSAGLKIGAYWYAYADSAARAKSEAEACLACIKGKRFDLPIYYDLEDSSIVHVGKSKLTEIAKTFCDAVKEAGYRPGVYANLNWFNNYLNYSELKKSYSIWLAQYNTKNDKECDIWQNSSTGKISGIKGNVDTDIILNSDVYSVKETKTTSTASTSKKTSSNSTAKASIKTVQLWAGVSADGKYGPITKKALIKKLQTALNKQYSSNLSVDGIWGKKTSKAISKVILKQGNSGDLVKVLQGFLICLGYDTNGFDGIYGEATANAVKKYQLSKGISADGIAGAKTFTKLCE